MACNLSHIQSFAQVRWLGQRVGRGLMKSDMYPAQVWVGFIIIHTSLGPLQVG